MRSSLEGWENTVSAMNDRPSSMSLARVLAAMQAASWACGAGVSGQRCLAISSALTKRLRGSNGVSANATKVDLPAPLGPTTRSSRFIDAGQRVGVGADHTTAVGPVFDEIARRR